jgi:hypothetical protein
MSGFDFNSMSEVQKKGASRGSRFKPALNLPVRIDKVHLADPNGKVATRGKDYIEAYLSTPAFGKDVINTVKVVLRDRGEPKDSERLPLEFFDLQMGKKVKGRYKVGQWPTIILEDARDIGNNTIECGWINVAEYSYDENPSQKELKELLQIGWVSVGYLNIPEDSSRFPSQYRTEHRVHEAEVISGLGDQAIENFRQLAINALSQPLDKGAGGPGFMIRLVNNNAFETGEGLLDAVKTEYVRSRWDKDAGTFEPAERTVDEFLANEDNASFVNWIANADHIAGSNGTLEIWPVNSYQVGKFATENEVKAKNAGRRHTAEDFAAPHVLLDGSLDLYDNGNRRTQWGLITEGMHKLVILDGKADWVVDKTFTLERFPSKLYAVEELPSKNLPETSIAYLTGLAAQRVEEKKLVREAKNGGPAAGQAAQMERPQDFGDEQQPDPTAGTKPAPSGPGFRPR